MLPEYGVAVAVLVQCVTDLIQHRAHSPVLSDPAVCLYSSSADPGAHQASGQLRTWSYGLAFECVSEQMLIKTRGGNAGATELVGASTGKRKRADCDIPYGSNSQIPITPSRAIKPDNVPR